MKKLRGKKRKLQMIEQRLTEATSSFPKTFYNNMYVWKLPASQAFVEGLKPKESAELTRFLVNCATALIEQKPSEEFKLTVLLFPTDMWHSQIIVFENSAIQDDFFTMQLATGHWTAQHVMDESMQSHWIVKQFTDGAQTIFCYIER